MIEETPDAEFTNARQHFYYIAYDSLQDMRKRVEWKAYTRQIKSLA